jgi:hypothetical protein
LPLHSPAQRLLPQQRHDAGHKLHDVRRRLLGPRQAHDIGEMFMKATRKLIRLK